MAETIKPRRQLLQGASVTSHRPFFRPTASLQIYLPQLAIPKHALAGKSSPIWLSSLEFSSFAVVLGQEV